MERDNGKIPKIYAIIGNNVRKLRKARGVSTEELAERVEMSYGSINRLERGVQFPKMHNFIRLCEYLDAPPYKLFLPDYDVSDLSRDDVLNVLVGKLRLLSDKELETAFALLEVFLEKKASNG